MGGLPVYSLSVPGGDLQGLGFSENLRGWYRDVINTVRVGDSSSLG